MTTVWGDPIEVNGICPGWLTKDDLVAMGDKTGLWTYEWETKPDGSEPDTWRWGYTTHIKLPQSHPYYTVDRHNKKHGTNFVYWQGGDDKPGDYGDGDCLWRNGVIVDECEGCRWEHRNNSGDIIGYTKNEEDKTTNDLPPDWAIIKAYRLAFPRHTHIDECDVLEAYKSGDDGETKVIQGFARYNATHEQAPIAIDPDLLLAREVVADENEKADYPYSAQQARSGEYDDELEMIIALAAIKAYKKRNVI